MPKINGDDIDFYSGDSIYDKIKKVVDEFNSKEKTNLNTNSLQFYFDNNFLILKGCSLKTANILEFNKKINLKDTPFYNMFSIELKIEL
ncbi:hypothetical protein [Borreliella bavariensis]|uniref:hypothetical protein n=1 Tax=Borreliella bavariensis TaxID=664662 RepID=UPI001C02FD54|nr:hypothetical protein [Borreliella bavariensis]